MTIKVLLGRAQKTEREWPGLERKGKASFCQRSELAATIAGQCS